MGPRLPFPPTSPVPAVWPATFFLGAIPMTNRADPMRLSPDGRFREVAAILAAGILRLRVRGAMVAISGGDR